MAPRKRIAPGEVPSVAIIVDTQISWARRVISGILNYAREHGPWHIHIEPTAGVNAVSLPAGWHGDAIIARISTRAMADKLSALGVPVVNVSAIRIEGVDFPRVKTLPESEGRLASEFFLSRGFRRFAYVGDHRLWHVNMHLEAFQKALGEHGQTCELHLPPGYDVQSASFCEWLRSLPKPIAIFTWGPSIGRRVIDACLHAGISVPHDVAVLGSDYDDLLSEASYPPQSGMRLASEQIGMTAAAIADEMMHGRPLKQQEWCIDAQGVVEKASTNTLAVPDPRIAAAMRFILEHANSPIGVEDILRANPMARRTLERKFRHFFGSSVVDQIRRIRLNRARLLLASSDDPVSVIAEKCGFGTYNYMGKVFRESTGTTPREYRDSCRAKRL